LSLRLSGGRRLASPPGTLARPTAGRVRLAVMNLLAAELPGSRWLDLCCGSAVMACEALQRGAVEVLAVEKDRRIAAVARSNLETTLRGAAPQPCSTAPRARVVCDDILRFLARRRGGGSCTRFDLIYLDPPYASSLYGPAAAAVLSGAWLRDGGTMIWECSSESSPPVPPGWFLRDRRRYGGSAVLLLEAGRSGRPDSPAGSPTDSPTEGAAAAILVPGRHEQSHQGDGDETEHDAAEQGFDHGTAGTE
jgi:16S rRNA (guanine(966)-N(2))-methyltransferase RsmD